MRVIELIAAVSLALGGWAAHAHADPGKDESGQGRERGVYSRYDRGVPGFGPDRESRRERRSQAAVVPNGHLPPPGECRTWNPRLPAGQQSAPYRC